MSVEIGNIKFGIYISRIEKRTGICSRVYEDNNQHILLWDFDNSDLITIKHSLRNSQIAFSLPTIYIIESSPKKYHAYCFASRSFRETIMILATVPEIDMEYLRLGVARGYFTLRISPRKNEQFKPALTLYSNNQNEISPLDITVNEYLTSNRGQHNEKNDIKM